MTELACEDVRVLSAEVALGIAGREETAAAADHLQSCQACRTELREMADVADGLAALAPEVEPPAGFTDRVVATVSTSSARQRPPRWAGLAAAAAAIALVGGLAGWLLGRPASHPGYSSRVLVGQLYTSGHEAGQVLVSSGAHPWMSVAVEVAPTGQWVGCVVRIPTGGTVTVGAFQLDDGRGYWAAPWPTPGSLLPKGAEVELVGAGGAVLAEGRVGTGD